jgi:hypothetical protein
MQKAQSMKQTAIFKVVCSILLLFIFLPSLGTITAFAQTQQAGTCSNGIDDDGDGRMDWTGGKNSKGELIPPDPSCVNATSNEVADDATGSRIPLIPCVNKCDLGSVMQLLNNLISALIKFLLFPIAIFMFIYAGFKYIMAQGNPAKRISVRKMVGKFILGMVLILTAWLIVKTLLVILGYTDTLYFFN